MASAQNDFFKGKRGGEYYGNGHSHDCCAAYQSPYTMWWTGSISAISRSMPPLSLTGLGVCLPVITAVMAFANLFGMGGAPLCSIERGRGNQKEAEAIMGNAFTLMVICGILLTILGIVFRRPLLYLSGPVIPPIPMRNPT